MLQSNQTSDFSSAQSFSQLGVPTHLVSAYKELNFINPTPIQQSTIFPGLQGRDIFAQSKAGTGKTLAYLSVVLSKIVVEQETVQGLILLPTRELALQVYDVASRIIKKLKKPLQIKLGLMIGGIPIEDDRNLLRHPLHLVIGTLGRVYGLVKEKTMKLNSVNILVLDEADKVVTTHGMRDQLNFLWARLDKVVPQVLSFSATYGEESFKKIKHVQRNPVVVRLSGERGDERKLGENDEEKIDLNVKTLQQYYCKIVRREDDKVGLNTLKSRMVVKILKEVKYDQVIIFYNDKGLGEELESELRDEEIPLHFIHGDQTQAERIRIMNKLKLRKVNVILSTDLLSRGIDIEQMSLVINFDVPRDMETYFHRVGRTGRFGRYGVSIILLTERDEGFIFNNKEYFVNIKELPAEMTDINNFLSLNVVEVGQVNEEAAPRSILPAKKEYNYGGKNQISEWQTTEYDFYDDSKWKYFDENAAAQNHTMEEEEGGMNEEEMEDFEEGNIKSQYINSNALKEHLHDDDPWSFLKCVVCCEYLKQSEQQLGRKFEILKYFRVQNNSEDDQMQTE